MPLVRISLRRGKSPAHLAALRNGIYQAMRETFNVPENDFFAIVTEHQPEDFIYDRHYFNIERSDDFLLIQLTVSNTRTLAQKQALFARIVERLTEDPGLRPEDVFINLVEVTPENWSFGNGVAQYVAQAA